MNTSSSSPSSTTSSLSESTNWRRTKIVATVGPASRSPAKIRQLLQAGVNVFRLNFSHGTQDEHGEVLQTIRTISEELNLPAAILQDLAGPKIRISQVEGDAVILPDGGLVELRPASGSKGTASCVYVEGLNPIEVLESGHPILLSDGSIVLRAESVEKDRVVCQITKGGRLRSRVGIAFPDSAVNLPATTDKDLLDAKWGIKHEVDYIAVSFVKSAADLNYLREECRKAGREVPLIAKVERKKACENIDEIVEASDGVMVARGDLGLEIPLERVPLVQKQLIEACNLRGIPVIVATQMLLSMVTSVRPTRAEVSDVSLAVMSGADAVMLSEETAIGEYPVESVAYLGRIALEAEKAFEFEEYKLRLRNSDSHSVPDAISYAACAAALKLGAKAIIACTETGTSARLVAKYRPQQPLFGTSIQPRAIRRMCLMWGVIPLLIPKGSETHFQEMQTAIRTVKEKEHLSSGVRVVITGGYSANQPGSTNILEVQTV